VPRDPRSRGTVAGWAGGRIAVVPDGPLQYPDPPLADGRIGLRMWQEGDVDCVRLASTDPLIP